MKYLAYFKDNRETNKTIFLFQRLSVTLQSRAFLRESHWWGKSVASGIDLCSELELEDGASSPEGIEVWGPKATSPVPAN